MRSIPEDQFVVYDHVTDDFGDGGATVEESIQIARDHGLTDFEVRRISIEVVYNTQTTPTV